MGLHKVQLEIMICCAVGKCRSPQVREAAPCVIGLVAAVAASPPASSHGGANAGSQRGPSKASSAHALTVKGVPLAVNTFMEWALSQVCLGMFFKISPKAREFCKIP